MKKMKVVAIALFSSLLLGSLGGVAAANESNLLKNGGFAGYTNDVLDNWLHEASPEVFAFPSKEKGEFISDTQGRGYWLGEGKDVKASLKQEVQNVPAGNYEASVWSRASTEGFQTLKLTVFAGDVALGSTDLPKGDAYAQAKLNITVSEASTLTYSIEALSAAGGVFVTLDDASLVALAAAEAPAAEESKEEAPAPDKGSEPAASGGTLPKTGSNIPASYMYAAVAALIALGGFLQFRKMRRN
jgi:LPXTG-motif cell wall-anchored protein